MPPKPNSKFWIVDRYRLDRRLGTGGMGEVFRAWDRQLRCPVALKRLLPETARKPKARQRFRHEVQVAGDFDHPNLVRLHDWVERGSGDWMVMELVEGQTLRQRLAEGPLDLDLAINLIRQIAEGLAAIHAKGFLHCDLKPENVMVTPAGQAKIVDFGLTRPVEDEGAISDHHPLCGTVSAMSPEQILGQPLDHRSDLFALGILLYEVVTGKAPFRTPEPRETLIRILTDQPAPARELRPGVPVALAQLIDDLLHKDPSRRPRSATLVARILAQAAGGNLNLDSKTLCLTQTDSEEVIEEQQSTMMDVPSPGEFHTRSFSTASAAIRPSSPTI